MPLEHRFGSGSNIQLNHCRLMVVDLSCISSHRLTSKRLHPSMTSGERGVVISVDDYSMPDSQFELVLLTMLIMMHWADDSVSMNGMRKCDKLPGHRIAPRMI